MQRLSDGHFCVLLPGAAVAVRGASVLDLPAPDAAERDPQRTALALARGNAETLSSTLPTVHSDEPDRVVLERLAGIGRGFAWHLAGLDGAAALTSDLRRLAARARAFGGLASLPLLPESAAGVALRLLARTSDDDEVLVHGGQLFVGLALALRGRRVTVWSDDEADLDLTRALAAEGLLLEARAADVLAPLDDDLRGRFKLVLVDTLAAHQRESALLSRALAAATSGEGREAGRVLALVHSMRRPLTRRLIAELPVTLEDALHEVAVRLHPGWAPAEFSWDEWVLIPTGPPALRPDQAISRISARDHDPSEQAHGCVEVQHLARERLTPEHLDRALALFAGALAEPPTGGGGHDDEQHLLRYRALPHGGQAAISVDKAEGVAAIDLFPWSPFLLAALVSALLVELGGALPADAPRDRAPSTVEVSS